MAQEKEKKKMEEKKQEKTRRKSVNLTPKAWDLVSLLNLVSSNHAVVVPKVEMPVMVILQATQQNDKLSTQTRKPNGHFNRPF